MTPPRNPRAPADRIAALFASALGDAAGRDAAGIDAAEHERVDPRVRAAETLYDRGSRGLARWFGAYGTHSLITRALLQAQIEHPALRSLTLGPRGDDDATAPLGLLGMQEGTRVHGHEVVAAALLALLTSLAELVSRLIGEELAMTILEQSIGGPRASSHAAGGRAAPVTPPSASPAVPPASASPTPDVDPSVSQQRTEP